MHHSGAKFLMGLLLPTGTANHPSTFEKWKRKKNGGNFLKKLHISIIIDDVIQFIKGVFANSDIH